MPTGWIKLHRKFLDWEWYGDQNTCRLFIHLLLTVNYEEKKWRGCIVKEGQIITGRYKLSEQTGLTENQIRLCLDKLKTTNNITIKTTNKYSLISINNWEDYQQNNQQKCRQTTTTKEIKEKKKDKIKISADSFFNSFKEIENKQTGAKAKKFDIRTKDVVYCANQANEWANGKELENNSWAWWDALFNRWINKAIRYHELATLSDKKKKEFKDTRTKAEKEEDEWIIKNLKIIEG